MIATARVLVDGASGLEFDYELPAAFSARVAVGSRVLITFKSPACEQSGPHPGASEVLLSTVPAPP